MPRTAQMMVSLTVWILAISLALVGLYDLLALSLWGERETVSMTVLRALIANPVVPLLVGVLIGHLFWPQRPLGP